MEFSEIFGFLIILAQSIKLFFKNLKIMSSIVILSHLLLSIISLFFTFLFTHLMRKLNYKITESISHMIIYFVLLLAVEIASFYGFMKISQVSTLATILASALSYKDKTLSVREFFSRVLTTWKDTPSITFRRERNMGHTSFILLLFIPWIIYPMYPNPITLSIAIVLGIVAFVYTLYITVASVLAIVVSVLEEKYDGKEAIEKAEELLLKGQRIQGFMMNILSNGLCLITFGISWIKLGDKWLDNLTIYGLVFVNAMTLVKMLMMMGYTVLYFQCKKIHGEEIKSLGSLEYSLLVNDQIP